MTCVHNIDVILSIAFRLCVSVSVPFFLMRVVAFFFIHIWSFVVLLFHNKKLLLIWIILLLDQPISCLFRRFFSFVSELLCLLFQIQCSYCFPGLMLIVDVVIMSHSFDSIFFSYAFYLSFFCVCILSSCCWAYFHGFIFSKQPMSMFCLAYWFFFKFTLLATVRLFFFFFSFTFVFFFDWIDL